MKYHLSDERIGKWTKVAYRRDCVEFRPTKTYMRGKVAGVIMVALVAFAFLRHLGAAAGWRAWLLAGCVAMLFGWSAFRILSGKVPSVTVVTELGSDPGVYRPGSRVLRIEELDRLILRENTGRLIQDPALAQVYVLVKGKDRTVLLCQDYLSKVASMRQVAQRLSQLWNVLLIDEINNSNNSG